MFEVLARAQTSPSEQYETKFQHILIMRFNIRSIQVVAMFTYFLRVALPESDASADWNGEYSFSLVSLTNKEASKIYVLLATVLLHFKKPYFVRWALSNNATVRVNVVALKISTELL